MAKKVVISKLQIAKWMRRSGELIIQAYQEKAPKQQLTEWLKAFAMWWDEASQEERRNFFNNLGQPVEKVKKMVEVGRRLVKA